MEEPATNDRDEWDAERVRTLRAWLASSQAELADRIGTRQQTVSEWETGSSEPRRMSRRLLRMVAEDSGFYDVERTAGVGATDGDEGARDRTAGEEIAGDGATSTHERRGADD